MYRGQFHSLTRPLAATLIAVFALSACKDNTPAPKTVSAPPPPPPTVRPATEPADDISDLEAVPLSEYAVMVHDPDGSIWQKYPSGVKMQDIKIGRGATPVVGQNAYVAGTISAADTHQEFARNTSENPLVIRYGSKKIPRGLTIALDGLKRGGLRRVFIPADLAYGDKGDPAQHIPPKQDLICEFELVSLSGEAAKLPEQVDPKNLIDKAMPPFLKRNPDGTPAVPSTPIGPPSPTTHPGV